MILSSVILVLVACATLVMGVRDSSMGVVLISIGCGAVSGAVLVISVKARTASGGDDAEAGGPPPPLPRTGRAVIFDATVAHDWNPWPAPAAPTSGPQVADADASSVPAQALAVVPEPPAPTAASSPSGPPLDLVAPGPGVLGRLRRRPLAVTESPGPPLTTRPDVAGPGARRSNGEACAAGRRPKSDSQSPAAVPAKAAGGTRGSAGAKARVPTPGPSTPRSRAAPKSAARKAAANGAGPAKPRSQAKR